MTVFEAQGKIVTFSSAQKTKKGIYDDKETSKTGGYRKLFCHDTVSIFESNVSSYSYTYIYIY